MIDYPIDLVVPFVDNSDPVWRTIFENFCKQHGHVSHLADLSGERYDNPGLFEYWLRLVDKYMPWIRTIHLIVSNKEQVPANINREKTHIVLHSDIIPEKFLPTFNSTTIEMFIPNITGLAEHFIYSNDDMYPTSPLTPDDFFAEDGRVRINMRSSDFRHCKTQFRQVCLNSYRRVADGLGVAYDAYNYLRPMHGMAPMIKSHCLDCLKMLGEDILIYATAFRTEKQHNQYIYTDYECLKYTVAPLLYPFRYLSFQLGSEYIANTIRSRQYKVICINDTKIPNRKKFKWQNIKNAFEDIL